jgi:hypothetical protein
MSVINTSEWPWVTVSYVSYEHIAMRSKVGGGLPGYLWEKEPRSGAALSQGRAKCHF